LTGSHQSVLQTSQAFSWILIGVQTGSRTEPLLGIYIFLRKLVDEHHHPQSPNHGNPKIQRSRRFVIKKVATVVLLGSVVATLVLTVHLSRLLGRALRAG
jgi:hypothetical protein